MLIANILLLLFARLIASQCFSNPNNELLSVSPYTIETVPSKNEYIIKFTSFDTKSNRRRYLSEFFQSINVSCYEIADKKPIFDSYPSDFDVVRIEDTDFGWSESGQTDSVHIRGVYEQRKVIRRLISSNNDDQYSYSDESEHELEKKKAKNKKKKESGGGGGKKRYKKRHMNRAIPKDLIDVLRVRELWSRGHVTGRGVNVAVFDTGLEENHPHFKYVRERIDWTDERDASDRVGHGTFVCGLIASRSRECLGLAPDVNLFVFKIFTKNQISYTSWFLDAFNYALLKNIDVLNLSIGGPDFMDMPFVNKVWEITSKGIIMVSGIGNDGPLYGTLNNPADQLDIIGVGGINSDDQIAKFSSRGMTTWELPNGYGRVKPDILTYSAHVRGSKRRSGCRTLSGTSVASPIVAGAVSLLVSLKRLDPAAAQDLINPGSVKQVLLASADRIDDANVFEQGAGKLNLVRAFSMMREYMPQASLFPSYLDLTECPYFWPFCTQPLYFTAMPVIFNVTVLNGMHSSGIISKKPIWRPSTAESGDYLKISISYSSKIWPWSGYLAVKIVVSEEAAQFDGIVEGEIEFEVESLVSNNETKMLHSIRSPLKLFLRARIIPTPPRQQRLLWDQFHNLRYPSGYFPRDDLKMKKDLLDWNADHLHTNFKDLYQYLRSSGYYLEVLGESINCFDASNYGALLVIDPEEEFHQSEVEKLYEDVTSKGLSLIVFAEWYNSSVIKEAKFYDENSRKWWTPVTGGANIPALNNLLDPFGIGLGDRVYEGEYRVSQHSAGYVSGTSIVKFPKSNSNYVLLREMKDQGEEFLADVQNKTLEKGASVEKVAILGLAQIGEQQSGRVVVYGDSNCIDSSNIKNDCFWLLSAVIEYACHNLLFSGFKETNSLDFISQESPVVRSDDVSTQSLKNYSKVLGKETLTCVHLDFLPANTTSIVPSDDRPSKKNFYRFLRFDSNSNFDEIAPDGLPERGMYELFEDDKDPTSSSLDDDYDLLTNFPIFAFFAVVLAFFYFFYKFVLRRRQRSIFKRHNSNQNLRRFSEKGKFNH